MSSIDKSDKNTSQEELREKDGSVSIHNKNIEILVAEMFQIKNSMSPKIAVDFLFAQDEISLKSYTTK